MIKFKELVIENFLSFHEAQYSLDAQGLVLIQGANKDVQGFDSNGSGKSALFEAFLWNLWGQTVRGLRYDEVVNLSAKKDCLVALEFEDISNTCWKVQRTRKHSVYGNKLILFKDGVEWNEDVDVQKKIDSILNIDFKSFTSTFVFFQGQVKTFTNSTDAEQKKLLERLYNLEKYSVLCELVSKEVKQFESMLGDITLKIPLIQGTLDKIFTEIETLVKKEKEFVQEVNKEVEELEKQLVEVEEQCKRDFDPYIQECADKILLLGKQKTDLSRNMDVFSSKQSLLEKENELLTNNLIAVRVENSRAEKELDGLYLKKRKFEIELTGTCPTCEQEIQETHKSGVIKTLSVLIQEIKVNHRLATQKKEMLEAKLQEVKNIFELDRQKEKSMKKEIESFYDKMQEALQDKSRFEKEKAVAYSRKNAIKSQIEEKVERLKKNPYTSFVDSRSKELDRLELQLESLNKEKDDLSFQLKHHLFLESAFSRSGIPNMLLENIIPALNHYANYYSLALTGGTLIIKFSNQVVLKTSNNIKEKFDISVVNSNGADVYLGDSGGEKRRVDLCVLLALQKVACLRSKYKFSVLFADEIFDTLDQTGVESVIQLLEDELETFPSIFVISHNSELSSYFDKVIIVEKVDGTSSILLH